MRNEAAGATARAWVQLILVPILFFAGAKLSLAFAVMPEVLVLLWIPNSILLATLMHFRWRRYAYFAAMILLAEIVADYPTFSPLEAALFGFLNLLEATIAYSLLCRWKFDPRFRHPADIAKFVMAGPLVSALVTACAAAAIYKYLRGTSTQLFELGVWWLSDGLGLLILTPLVLSVWPPVDNESVERVKLRWYDALALSLLCIVLVAFSLSQQRMFYGVPLRSFLLIPPLLYVAARFSMRTTTLVVLAFSALIIFLTKNGQQPFGDVSIRETVLSAQELVFVISTVSFSIAALLSQHRVSLRILEDRVQERTFELKAANEQLQQLALTDPLTGLLNRRAFFDVVLREMERERRHQHGLALILFDLDHFKEVNDSYGHAAGDDVLQQLATVVKKVVRGSDVIARYGGEEFVVVTTDTDEARALQLAQRMHEAIRSYDFSIEEKRLRMTASFGVSVMSAEDRQAQAILTRADRAMYIAKLSGRDRVVAESAVPT